MKIATKTLVSLLIITVLALGNSGLVQASSSSQKDSRIDRVTRRHDRKLELQASVLGIPPEQLREELKTSTWEQVLKKHGFKNKQAFRVALAGKIKDELKKRGWSDSKIHKVVKNRLDRLHENA